MLSGEARTPRNVGPSLSTCPSWSPSFQTWVGQHLLRCWVMLGAHSRARGQGITNSPDDSIYLLCSLVPSPFWDPPCGILAFSCWKSVGTLFYSKNREGEAQGASEMCVSDAVKAKCHTFRTSYQGVSY